MDSSALGELLIRARTSKDDVILIINNNVKTIIHPWVNYEFKKDSLVLKDSIISLDAISMAKIIPVNKIKFNKDDEEYLKPSKRSMRMIG